MRILELNRQVKALEVEAARVAAKSTIACQLASIPGYGAICTAELAGEIGTIERFRCEASLALYLGMATLDNSSGKYRGSKAPKHVNARPKAAMMAAVDHHRKRVPQSHRYYEKKRAEGKRHNQAIRALGRHLCRVIFKMLSQERPYRIDPGQKTRRFFSESLFQSPAGCSTTDSTDSPAIRLLIPQKQTKTMRKRTCRLQCLLLGVKRTLSGEKRTSALGCPLLGAKRTYRRHG